jgi:HAD superfamily hydrolase (TIGR01509 family)
MRGSPFDLVIFDCDGVLVDSEPISNKIFHDLLVQAGWSMSSQFTFATFTGRSLASSLELAENLLGQPLPKDLAKLYEATVLEHLKSELRPIEDIDQALININTPCCVASSSDHQRIRLSLLVTGLAEIFGENIYSADDVARGKPEPDLFLYAARQMGYQPSKAAVIEDSIPGVQAGIAAGMTVFAYTGSAEASSLRAAGAHHTFNNMRSLPDLLDQANSVQTHR